jgi:putative flippase GtrA
LQKKAVNNPAARQLARYLLAGCANTVFGYGIYVALNYALAGRWQYAYLAASVLSNLIAITVAYINYKFFVFKTKKNYLQEYVRFYVVYGFSFVLGLAVLPIFVEMFGFDAYTAGALLLPITVLVSFIGHKRYAFQSVPDASVKS